MAIAGLRGTGDWGTDERPKNFRESILWLNPNGEAPLTALLSRMSTQSTDDPEFAWWEEEQGHTRVQVNGAATIGATSITVDSGALNFVAGDVIIRETAAGLGELLQVTANPTTDTTLTVARGVAGSTASAIADDEFLTKVSNAFEEGTLTAKAVTRNPVKLRNYTQIMKTVYSITNTAKKTRVRTGDPVQNDKKRKMFDHSVSQEMAYLFGRAFEDTSGSKPKRYTGGLNSFINTNRTVFSGAGTLTEDTLIDAIAPVWDYNGEGAGNERLAFCGNNALTALNKLARNSSSVRVNYEGTVKTYGMELHKWVVPQGTIFLRTHPLLNTHDVFSGSMFIINPRGIKYRPLRDTNFRDNIQPPDADYLQGEWLTEAGIEVHHEKTMAYLGGVNGDQL